MKLMNKIIKFFFLIILICFTKETNAQIELTGFFDVIHGYDFDEKKNSGYQINQFEVDISNSFKGHVSLGAAIEYNNQNENMELAMAYLHYNMVEGETKHPRHGERLNHTGIIVEKFDIPFGLDYLSFASPDRPFVSQPLIVEKTIGGWNDIGLDIHYVKSNFKIEFWTVNGFSDGINIGGNVRYFILQSFQIGLSHATDFDVNLKRKNSLNSLNLVFDLESIEIKSEYFWTDGLYEGAPDTMCANKVKEGFYLKWLTDLEEWIDQPFFAA